MIRKSSSFGIGFVGLLALALVLKLTGFITWGAKSKPKRRAMSTKAKAKR